MGKTKTKRSEFKIALRNNGYAVRLGYVRGDFAAHKLSADGYFWKFTHVPTGLAISTYPVHETKASALAHLECLATGEALNDHAKAELASRPVRFGT